MKIEKSQILNAFNFRHACKEFDNTRFISEEDFRFILETARLSPSSFGFEHWKILVVNKNKALKDKINDTIWGAKKSLPTCSHYVIILGKKKSLFSKERLQSFMKNVQNLDDSFATARIERFQNFVKDDFKIENERNFFEWSCRQTYIVLANMMTSAACIGIDSCAIEGFNKETMDNFLERELGINLNEYGTSVMCAFGYRINEPKTKTRQKIENIVDFID